MAFDATKPAHGTLAKSVEMRSNFLALVIHHRATTAPTGAEEGWIWWDASDPSNCLLYTSPSPRDRTRSRMPSSA